MEKIQDRVFGFVERLSDGQTKPMRNFVSEMMTGLLSGRSVMLSDIGRSLNESSELKQTEKRLSRNLSGRSLDDNELRSKYLGVVAKAIDEDCVIAVDTSDIKKKYAEKMEYLARVWDGSEGEVTDGYWLMQIEAVWNDGRHMPLWLSAWSQDEKAHDSENMLIHEAVEFVAKRCGRKSLWVMDRGFDRKNLIGMFSDLKIDFVIRQVGKRIIEVDGQTVAMRDYAETMPCKKKARLTHIHRGKSKTRTAGYGWSAVTLKKGQQKMWLVVVRGFGGRPVMLLTNRELLCSADALKIVLAYGLRWGCEEGTRFIKQTFDLENVRALTFRGVKRIAMFAGMAYGILCWLHKTMKKTVLKLIEKAKFFGEIPKFLYYRLVEVVRGAEIGTKERVQRAAVRGRES